MKMMCCEYGYKSQTFKTFFVVKYDDFSVTSVKMLKIYTNIDVNYSKKVLYDLPLNSLP